MKKLTALILTAVMLVCMTAIVPVSAEGKVVMAPSAYPTEVNPGDTIDLVWKITENPGFAYLAFDLVYDKEVFSFVSETERLGANIQDTTGLYGFEVAPNADMMTSMMNKFNFAATLVNFAQGKNVDEAAYFTLSGNQQNVNVTYTGDLLKVTLKVAEEAKGGNYDFDIVFDADNTVNWTPSKLDVTTAVETITVKVLGDEPAEKPAPYVAGCQVRGPVNGQKPEKFGYRFVSTVSETLKAASTEVGTLVIPTDLLNGAALTVDTANVAKIPAVKFMNEEGTMFNATMVDIKTANLTEEFTAVAYAIVDGAYVYGDAYTVKISDVAAAIVADANADQALKDYVQENVLDLIA